MNNNPKLWSTALLMIFSIAACKHDPIVSNPDPVSTSVSCHPDTVYFANDVLPILQANCASATCHSDNNPADGLSLTNYQGILTEVKPGDAEDSDLYEVLVESGDDIMPPSPASPLDSLSIWKIKTWINQGALQNACTDCDTISGSYSATIEPILQAQCLSCHQGTTPSGGVNLSEHSGVVSAVNYSSLEAAIARSSATPMPPASSLSECELEQFNIWINNGMPNN